jgi:hypothetical protein
VGDSPRISRMVLRDLCLTGTEEIDIHLRD